MSAPNMNLVSEVLPVHRRDFSLATAGLLNPNNANPLVDGEFLQLNSSYQLARGSGAQVPPAWAIFAERGRYDTQAIGKTTVLFLGGYEAETRIADLTGLSVGSPVGVDDVTIDGVIKRGLILGASGDACFGYVTRLPGSGRVRFWNPNSLFRLP